ncbi:MAG: SUMF1/EgtB/PvdO family nonheme iron enzyme [Planctomycetaceae bacterium]|nr:SUMF1/EgtB/PvdO family nonheme iron enzyme [Planctomycetaceae bacterium]
MFRHTSPLNRQGRIPGGHRLPFVILTFGLLTLVTAPVVHAQSEQEIERADRVAVILQDNCFRCHGEDGADEGGLNNVLNIRKLVARGLIVPGDATGSDLMQRIVDGDMPADDDPLSADDQALLTEWINTGALDFNAQAKDSAAEFISPLDMFVLIENDLKTLNGSAPQFTRYFSLAHLANTGKSAEQMDIYREGLSKLVNSLSWGEKIVQPQPIDPGQTLFRIDLRNYRWSTETWDKIAKRNPYDVRYQTDSAEFAYQITQTDQPVVRADWFVAVASVPPLYNDILELPDTDRELEAILEVDVDSNIERGLALRAGFNNSGVSQNNRMIERHETEFGAYWKSYDFSGNAGRKNLFANPLGPKGDDAFEHDGGEMIFNLPNGMQAYYLADAKGTKLDKGPVSIVSDPQRPDRSVINGLSCMSCHTAGMIPKTDQIRASVEKNPGAFDDAEREQILSLYPKIGVLDRLMDQDKDRFLTALQQAGVTSSKKDPILQLARQFEQELDLETAAAESGLTTSNFAKLLTRFPKLARIFAPLNVPGGTVQREVFVQNFPEIAQEFALQQEIEVNSVGMQMVTIPAGSFQMGIVGGDTDAQDDEQPSRQVTITRSFRMGANEVTVGQFRQFVAETGHQVQGGYRFDADRRRFLFSENNNWDRTGLDQTEDHPVVNINWNDAVAFCDWLSNKERATYRLPTEAEWEYACRAGTTTRFASGNGEEDMFIVGNFAHDKVETLLRPEDEDDWDDGFPLTAPTGQFQPNRFGLFDMHGNVWEWCQDTYMKTFTDGPATDPTGPTGDNGFRVVRGGSWAHPPARARSSERAAFKTGDRNLLTGFRVVKQLD